MIVAAESRLDSVSEVTQMQEDNSQGACETTEPTTDIRATEEVMETFMIADSLA